MSAKSRDNRAPLIRDVRIRATRAPAPGRACGDCRAVIAYPVAIVIALAATLLACSEENVAKDPFAYCASVGTIDAPDARYTGDKLPDSLLVGMKKVMGFANFMPHEEIARGTSWRCMDGKVYACYVGANLPCAAKADESRVPAPALEEFCRYQKDANVIPAAVTGRETIYAWRCRDRVPEIVREVTRADARGFLANIWEEIPRE
jgi:hypothetical protein